MVPIDRRQRMGSATLAACGVVLAAVRRNHFPIAAKPSGNNHPLALVWFSVQVSGVLCRVLFTMQTDVPTGRSWWWACYFARCSWCSAFLRENSRRIPTFSKRRIGWFAPRALRRLLINCSRAGVRPPQSAAPSPEPLVSRISPWPYF
jgi:hypothetical protein